MTDAVEVSVIMSIGVIIAATVPTLATIRSRKRTKEDLSEIHVLVNGRYSAAIAEIASLRSYIDSRLRLPIGETSEQAVPQQQAKPPAT